ncbi:MAG: amidohydrolase [Alphaproteobacteria bacterium PA2]|nr:MAG: amidohydrolase [Alphaproteobacteria bacterium PA2]
MNRKAKGGVDRRDLLTIGGVAVAASALSGSSEAAATNSRMVTVTEGTNLAVAASPDGKSIAMDLHGSMWTLPVAGGPARRLTDELTDGAQPDWTPDSKTLVFQSYRAGNFHIWSVKADGTGLTQLISGPFDCREPRVSPDGGTIAFAADATGRYAIHIMPITGGAPKLVAEADGQACQPCWSPDGKTLAYVVDRRRIETLTLGGARTVAFTASSGEVHSPNFSPESTKLVFTHLDEGKAELRTADAVLVKGADVFPFRPTWLPNGDMIFAADGQIQRQGAAGRKAVPFEVRIPVARPFYRKRGRNFDSTVPSPVVGIGSPVLSPDGAQIAFRALNDLYIMPLGGPAKALTKDRFWKCDPAWSPDGLSLAYSTDRGGDLQVWVRTLATGEDRQITRHSGAALAPAWSRNGKTLAFLDQTGALHTAEVATGKIRQILPAIWEPGRPSWSADGKTIALAAFKPYSARYREGLSEILTVDVATSKTTYQPHAAHKSLGVRGDDGPVWSPDGARLAYVFASRLWVVEVDPQGGFIGRPKVLNNEVTDAPSWAGDSNTLLYLSAGKLRLLSLDGGPPRDVPLDLKWANARPQGRTVVRAARVWDGIGAEARKDLDIVISGNRIAHIVPKGRGPKDARLVEAPAGTTVIPGLVEMHAHRQMAGYAYGDREGRLWLSLGVTTTRSPGSPAYHMVEDREALDSGARIGPRYFATGEAIDGGRIYYNFMRPVTEPGQMALELERVSSLSYDLIKAYVRLPLDAQRDLTTWAHANGLPVTSHYHYPALAFGLDGMEHMGATSRFGYSRTASFLGASYQDVTALFAASGARRTPTLFSSAALYAQDRSLVDDPRTRALYPPWEYARLKARVDMSTKGDLAPALESLERNVAHLRAMLKAGGKVVTGTDSPIDFNGISLHMNLRAMVRYGMTPVEALRTATRAAGDFLDQPLGYLSKGALADLVICRGDPLARIEDAAAVDRVMKNGEVFDIPGLIGPFSSPVRQARAASPFAMAAASQPWWHDADYIASGRAACCTDPFCATPSGRRTFIATEA